jgi:hypothetical protein
VWPGSAQTALLFVGLPLLMALVLMATPLHDATPPSVSEEASASVAAEAALTESVVAPVRSAPQRPVTATRPRRPEAERVPAVIFETRRTIAVPRERLQEALRSSTAMAPPATSRRRPPSEVRTVAAFEPRRDVRGPSAEPQSP